MIWLGSTRRWRVLRGGPPRSRTSLRVAYESTISTIGQILSGSRRKTDVEPLWLWQRTDFQSANCANGRKCQMYPVRCSRQLPHAIKALLRCAQSRVHFVGQGIGAASDHIAGQIDPGDLGQIGFVLDTVGAARWQAQRERCAPIIWSGKTFDVGR